MAKTISKTLQIKIDATQGIKSINELQQQIKILDEELGGLQFGTEDFKVAKERLDQLETGFTKLSKSSTESFLQLAEAAKNTAESVIQISGLIAIYTASTDEAALVTSKLAQLFAVVGTVEKTYQAITQGIILVKEAQAIATITATAATEASLIASQANVVVTGEEVVAENTLTTSLYAQAIALALVNPLTAAAVVIIGAGTAAYFAFGKSISETIEIQAKEAKRLEETNDAINNLKLATIELTKSKKILNGLPVAQADIEARIEESKAIRESIQEKEAALEIEKAQLAEIQAARSKGFARLRRDIFGENQDILKALQEKENAIKESEEKITNIKATENNKQQEDNEKALDKDRAITKERQDRAIEQLSTETSIFAKRQVAQLEFSSAVADIDNEFAKGKLTNAEKIRATFLEEDKLRSRNIELLRQERNEALETRNITREGIIKDLQVKNDIASKYLTIQLEQQQAEDELATAILNKEIPAIQQATKSQDIKNDALRKNLVLQKEINELSEESERAANLSRIETIIRKLNEDTGSFVDNYNNDLKIITAETITALDVIDKDIRKRRLEAAGNPELIKLLDEEKEARDANAKSIEAGKIKERNKSFAIEEEQEKVKNVAIEELQRGSLERQLQKEKTTFEERKKINQALLDLEVNRLRAQEALQIAQAGNNQAEIDRIKQTTDEAIKTAEGLTEIANKKIDDNILTKVFGSPDDINDYVEGAKNISAAIRSTVDALDKVITGNAGDNFKAINLALAETQDLTVNLIETIQSFGEDTSTEEKVAAIVQVVGTTLIAITNVVNDAIQSVIERSIDNVDKELELLETRKDELEEEITASADRLKELEDNLQKAKLADKEAIIKAIEQERLKEAQLQAQKRKAADEEFKLLEKKKELQRKAFQAQKAAAIATAIINTAIAVSQAFAQFGPTPPGFILAALAGVLGAVQIGVIASQPVPEFRDGGFTPSDSNDGKLVGGVHANEYVIPAPIVRSPRFRPMIDDIERARLSKNGYQSGGIVTPGVNTSEDIKQLMTAAMAMSNRPIFASIIDINSANSRQIEIIEQTTL